MAPAATSGKPVKPSRKGKMQIHLWLDPLLVRRARMAAPMLDKSVKEVVTEAFLDYLTKHKVPEV